MSEVRVVSADFVGIVSYEEDQTASVSFLAEDKDGTKHNLHMILTHESLRRMCQRIQNELAQMPDPSPRH